MKRIFCYLITLGLISVFGYVACGPKDSATPREREAKPVEARPEKVLQDDWQKALVEAKREGELSVYWGGSLQSGQRIGREFKEKFGIAVSLWSGSSMEQVERMSREFRAGIFNVDVMITDTLPCYF